MPPHGIPSVPPPPARPPANQVSHGGALQKPQRARDRKGSATKPVKEKDPTCYPRLQEIPHGGGFKCEGKCKGAKPAEWLLSVFSLKGNQVCHANQKPENTTKKSVFPDARKKEGRKRAPKLRGICACERNHIWQRMGKRCVELVWLALIPRPYIHSPT